ncbi:MAG: chloride channel protein [Novosphingobium sp.]
MTIDEPGGGVASAFACIFRRDAESPLVILMAGIAAGFGAVFGTPLAGAIFSHEVLAVSRAEYRAPVPALLAAIVGDWAWPVGGRQACSVCDRIAALTNATDLPDGGHFYRRRKIAT